MSVISQSSADDSENGRHSFPGESDTDAGADTQDGDNNIAEGTTYEVLSNERRRYVVYLLKQDGGRIAIGEMAEQVAAWEYDISVQQVMGDQRKRVYTALQQTHLPMMDDAGLIVFNKDRGIVTPEPAVQKIEVYQESADEETTSWSEYYLGLSSVGALLVTGSAAGLPPLNGISMSLLAAILLAVFLVSSVRHWHVHRDTDSGVDGKPPEVNRGESD
jgi:hypothetical protein